MDIYCVRCGEPWDNDELHEEAKETGVRYVDVARRFRTEGCKVFGVKCEKDVDAQGRGVIYDLLGDDIDGASVLIEDLI